MRSRGAALLLVITAIAILTAISVDLAYESRVSIEAAAGARDELRATYLAKSAVGFSRLVLHFQQQLGQASAAVGQLGQVAQASGLPAQLAQQLQGTLGGGAGGGTLSIRLWELVPVDSSMTSLFLSRGARSAAAPPREGAAAAAGTARGFGDFEGSFHARIEDEDRKINLPQFNGLGALPAAQLQRFLQLVKDPKYDFLFDQDDANGIRVNRNDTAAAIKDWVDEDEVSSAVTGNPLTPFEQGFSDENAVYDRLPDRYKAKNARFDSLEELFLVAGISDAFMAAFADRLTVYPDVNGQVNVNTDDPMQILTNLLVMSDPPGVLQGPLLDPGFPQRFQAALAQLKPLPFLSVSPQQFATVAQALGVKIQAVYLQAQNSDNRAVFSDHSSTFHIHATGRAGGVQKTIDAVVTLDTRAGALAQDLGRVLHWSEE
ncbi:type II secretion system protein GspK [Anaeromyxobacter paludicola]|uniref:T2SS protein K first SAM-like domain-containing protein n=1 Tax=Anaeromyxobacter paludicola TaxID=2918171 RepID=A0ABM7XAV5_9BACT|nr:type II secretion system protein GspK [Anaeromyxobacter paludicola]BDG08986.1 hypothetical protein AMPC_20990 [Anaeromyxobacter paludicola]